MQTLKYPVGEQDFGKIINDGYVYVDKTADIHRLVTTGSYYFLSRPRRFGKSLLISTLEAYFEGRRELFKGLAIDSLQPEEWEARPVLRFDLSAAKFTEPGQFYQYISQRLDSFERRLGITTGYDDISGRFMSLVEQLHSRSGKKVVILIDEYDSPLTRNVGNLRIQEMVRDEMHTFYSCIKPLSQHIHFFMLTGVTKYAKLSIFSSLNNLNDISFDEEYSSICGITEEELHDVLMPGVELLAEKARISTDEAFVRLKYYYDGYHFSRELKDVYNPFSLILALSKRRFGEYWFETGTPTMLVQFLQNPLVEIGKFEGEKVSEETLSSISLFQPQLLSLLYQTGYLTIKDYDERSDRFILGFPNREVESGFFNSLLPIYAEMQRSSTENTVYDLSDYLIDGEVGKFADTLTAFVASIPESLHHYTGKYESHYQLILYLLFRAIGMRVSAEYSMSDGYMDIVVKTDRYIYIIELKVRGTSADALRQIEEKGYALPFAADSRKLYRIGIAFDPTTHRISDISVEE